MAQTRSRLYATRATPYHPPAMPDAAAASDLDPARLERELKELIVRALKLDDVAVDEIDSEAPLVGEGLGLDSIDVLELAMAVQKEFGVRAQADDAQNQRIFASVKSLAAFIVEQRADREGQ
jgi:acyl carrier protein